MSSSAAAASSRWQSAAILLPTIATYLLAAWCLVALAWDGSGYLFNSVQAGTAIVPHHRFSNLPMMMALVAASHHVTDPLWLGVGYGLLLALTPVLSLAACLTLLRGPGLTELRVWPVLGILLGTLPGEICLMSEASLAVQAFWPLAAFAAAGLPKRGVGWMIVLVPYLFFLHPTAAVMFGIASALCLGLALWQRERFRIGVAWAGGFAVLAAIRLAYSILTASSYERGELGWRPNYDAFMGAIVGWPIGLLLGLYIAALACLACGLGRFDGRRAGRWLVGAGAGIALIGWWWAIEPERWNGALSYRRFVLLCAMPLVGMAALHWAALRRRAAGSASRLPWAPVFFTLVFCGVYAVQSWTWRCDIKRFQAALRDAPGPFITAAELPWLRHTALDHWSASMLSILAQGRQPRTVFTLKAANIQGRNILLYPNGWLHCEDGWFKLAHIPHSQ
jgi:hypothetical protein